MTKIKICGLSRPCDIDYVNLLRPDYIGFVFAPRSRRYASPAHARTLRDRLTPGIAPVGVFVNAPRKALLRAVDESGVELIQLHGQEDETYLAALRDRTKKPIIQAFSIRTAGDLDRALRSAADYLLLDNGSGGTGTAFDWSLLPPVGRPFFLAGGICAENAAQAIETLRPYAVDASSGVETDGHKDFSRMEALISRVRNSDQSVQSRDAFP